MSVWEISELQMLPKWTKESFKNRFSLPDFIGWIYQVGGAKVFHLGIKRCSAFLFFTCKIRAKDKRMHIRKEIPALPKPGMFNHKTKKTMIQTKNKYCKETFIRLNYWYDRIHGLVREDIEKVNAMVEHIEKTRSDQYPHTGDSLFFISGYGERSQPFLVDAVYGDNIVLRNFSRVPFVSRDKKGIKCDMHGGECVLVKADDVKFKAWTTGRFKHWGHVKTGRFTTMRK